jgi:hypothetical protein
VATAIRLQARDRELEPAFECFARGSIEFEKDDRLSSSESWALCLVGTEGDPDERSAAVDAELQEHALDSGVDALRPEAQKVGDLLRIVTCRDELEDLALAGRESWGGVCGSGRAVAWPHADAS